MIRIALGREFTPAPPRWETMTGTAVGIRDWGDTLAGTANALLPIHDLTKRIIELLQVEKEDLVVDLCCRDGPSVTLEEVRLRSQTIAVSPFGERLARLLITSGVRMVQMSDLTFGRFLMRYEKVLLRGGFSQFKNRPHDLLAPLFSRLESAARFLVVDSAPSPDTPLFADGLRRWERHHCPPEAIAGLMREAGFFAQVEVVKCARRVPAADCYAWVESRDWPILEAFSGGELRRGLTELRDRYGSQQMVEFTSCFDLVLGVKPGALGRLSSLDA